MHWSPSDSQWCERQTPFPSNGWIRIARYGVSTWSRAEVHQLDSDRRKVRVYLFRTFNNLTLLFRLYVNQASRSHFALALIQWLLDLFSNEQEVDASLGVLYDIGCNLDKTIKKVCKTVTTQFLRRLHAKVSYQSDQGIYWTYAGSASQNGYCFISCIRSQLGMSVGV